MVLKFETLRNDKGIADLQSLKVSHLSVLPDKFYDLPKSKNWMRELCTFSQIRSHIIHGIIFAMPSLLLDIRISTCLMVNFENIIIFPSTFCIMQHEIYMPNKVLV